MVAHAEDPEARPVDSARILQAVGLALDLAAAAELDPRAIDLRLRHAGIDFLIWIAQLSFNGDDERANRALQKCPIYNAVLDAIEANRARMNHTHE